MAAFSFNCPQCGKTYDNVKAKMAGRRVRCICSKVFRLGPKTDEQKRKAAERKARKLARLLEEERSRNRRSIPAAAPLMPNADSGDGERSTNPLAPILKNRHDSNHAFAIGSSASVTSGNVVDAEPAMAELVDEEDDDIYVAMPVSNKHSDSLVDRSVEAEQHFHESPDEPVAAELVNDSPQPPAVAEVVRGIPVDESIMAELNEPVMAELDEPAMAILDEPIIADHDEPLMAELVDGNGLDSGSLTLEPAYFEQDVLAEIPGASGAGTPHGTNRIRGGLATPLPAQIESTSADKVTFDSYKKHRGTIWTIIYSFPASLGQLSMAFWFLGQSSRGSSMLLVGITKILGLVLLALAAAIFISGIYAVIELLKGKRNRLPTMIAGYLGLAGFSLLAIITVIAVVASGGYSFSLIVGKFLWFLVASAIPVLAMITGYLRNKERFTEFLSG